MRLYHLGSFFAEVCYDPEYNVVLRTRSFTSWRCLLDYAVSVRLDDLNI